jgi:predicted transcriptional regulator
MRLRVKVGYSEVELEGTMDEIVSAIDLIPSIVNVTKEAKAMVAQHQSSIPVNEEIQIEKGEAKLTVQEPDLQLPSIQISKEDSIGDIIVKIVNSSWGKKPRKLDEIRKVLETFGFPLTRSTAAVTLLRLTKGGKIRRFKDESGEYLYLQLISTAAEQAPQESDGTKSINPAEVYGDA